MRKRNLLLTAALFFGVASFTNAQEAKKEKKISDYVTVGGWVDFQYDYQNEDSKDELNTFQIRRARLDVKGQIDKMVEFRLQGDFCNSPALIDGFVKVKFNDYINFQAGQFKSPFTIENPYSPLDLELIENAQVISQLSGYKGKDALTKLEGEKAGRAIGISLYGRAFKVERNGAEFHLLKYDLGIFNGNGINVKDDNFAKTFVGRLEFYPFLKDILISGSMYYGTYSAFGEKDTETGETKKYDADKIRYAVGARYDDGKIMIRSEYLTGKTGIYDEGINDLKNQNSDGVYVSAGYWFTMKELMKGLGEQKVRPVIRYDYYRSDVDAENSASSYYTAGVDWWLQKHLCFKLDYTYRDVQAKDNARHCIAAQISVKF